ncbi:MAG: hypothetical protein ABIP07_06235 [Sphingomicrobium sp.]
MMLFFKSILPLAILLTSTSAYAAGTGPTVAYATRGGQGEIYLVDPGGSPRLVYRGPRRTAIFNIDMKPGGGELSFEETNCCSAAGPTSLKTLQYGISGLGTVSRSLPITGAGCRIGSIDYHPDPTNGSLIYTGNCSSSINRLAAGATTPTEINISNVAKAAWTSDGLHILYVADALRKIAVATPENSEIIVATNCVATLDAGSTLDVALLSIGQVCGGPRIDFVDVATKTLQTGIQQGQAAHLSPNDNLYIYISPYQRGGSYLLVRQVNGNALVERIGAKAEYSAVDWRN